MRLYSDLRPVDRVVAAYNLVALAGWLALVRTDLGASSYAAIHLVIALGFGAANALARTATWRWRRRGPGTGRLTIAAVEIARDTYPLAAIILAWRELGVRHLYIHGSEANTLVMELDSWLVGRFVGGHPNLLWAPAMPWVSEVMQAIYLACLPMLVLVVLSLVVGDDRERRRDVVLRLALTFFACFGIHTLFPTDGPLELFPRFISGLQDGPFLRLNILVRSTADSLGTAFPSLHVASAFTLAWVALRWCTRGVARLCVILAAVTPLVVVYTQNHFAADAAAALITVFMVQSRASSIFAVTPPSASPQIASPQPLGTH